jgi:serine/threonine protein kinase
MTLGPQQPPDLPGFRYDSPIEGGDGGYAKVFKYEQQSPRRPVAVKVLRGRGLGQTQYQAMLDEATAMAVLETHPHVVPVIGAAMSTDGQPCIIMMFCGGPTLMTLVTDEHAPDGRPRLLSVRRVVRLGIQIASVVQAAHEKGIVHRDIKPANILTDDRGSPRLTDFGIAGRLDAADEEDRQFGLSLPWCPPEILAGQQGTVASDIFSLGATLWHLLGGRSPFDVPGQNSQRALETRIADPQPRWTGRRDVPDRLERLLARMMAKQPDRRPGSAAEVVAELTSIEQQTGAARPDEPWHTDQARSVAALVHADMLRTKDRPAGGAVQTSRPAPVQAPFPSPEPPPGYGIPVALPARTELKRRPPTDAKAAHQKQEPETVTSGASRWLWITGVVVLLVATAGLIVMRPWQQKAQQRPSAVDGSGNAGGGAGGQGDSLPPGKPEVTATRVDAQTLRFSWTYSAPLDSDTYLWRTTTSEQAQAVNDPTVDVKSPSGTRACIVVKVVRADGSYGTVAWSDEGCGS